MIAFSYQAMSQQKELLIESPNIFRLKTEIRERPPINIRDPNNLGYEAESRFLEAVSNLGVFKEIKYENDLKKEHGWPLISIDFLLVAKNGIVPVQIKYRGSRRRETHGIENFINSLVHLSKCYKDPVLFGLWVSRLKPFDDNQEKLMQHKVVCIDCYESLDGMIQRAIESIGVELGASDVHKT